MSLPRIAIVYAENSDLLEIKNALRSIEVVPVNDDALNHILYAQTKRTDRTECVAEVEAIEGVIKAAYLKL